MQMAAKETVIYSDYMVVNVAMGADEDAKFYR